METLITMTSKGQFTFPSDARKTLRLKSGSKMLFSLNDQGVVTMSKPLSIEELSAKITSYIKPGTKPVLNVDKYYQEHRKPRI